MSKRICLVEDDAIMGESLQDRLRMEGYAVSWFTETVAAEAALTSDRFAVVISDIRLPDADGGEWFRRLQSSYGGALPPFIFITGFGTIDAAVGLVKDGAADYLTKPFNLDALVARVAGLSENGGAEQGGDAAPDPVLGVSPAMRDVEGQLRRVGAARAGCLITGESGTGKEFAARYLHQWTPHHGELVAVNCGALTESLLEAELFGHERGAFTGAQRRHQGLFEQAQGGTLLLDEIGEMSATMQVKLLRVIQERRIRRVGGERSIPVDVQLVFATHRDLRAMVSAGAFREDLYYRINVVHVRLPPLRERPEDILWFARAFLREIAGDAPPRTLSPAAERVLMGAPWPGNLRELHHALERAVIMSDAAVLEPRDLFPEIDEPAADNGTLSDYLKACEKQRILATLQDRDGQIQASADALGISRKSLWERMRRYGIRARDLVSGRARGS
ncbi:sigma-54-dependent Fis family transcriptional regulator [Aquisalimonas sp. 2447]|uniref:sigma-54-dependent transcriptional regulator n=1 Tax=Aquisalimonas sp. 2447 TaxID=2740807 RepID=UPI0014326375|nr:sigma-54 dependent transcriptional regulator [Aquisalimonas sp. 2447]QIT54921.1 sigma-54-dependent Fis family transcriptional regulator [Aquisalimonas sp. 2447]